jgi:hypothetical protein
MHGRAAVRALGTDLTVAARRNDRSAPALAQLLRSDPTMWLDPTGRLFVKDPATPAASVTPSLTAPAPAASFPYADTFTLHSRPGAQRTLYLD